MSADPTDRERLQQEEDEQYWFEHDAKEAARREFDLETLRLCVKTQNAAWWCVFG